MRYTGEISMFKSVCIDLIVIRLSIIYNSLDTYFDILCIFSLCFMFYH